MDFSRALICIKAGMKVSRDGWNGKDLSVELQIPDDYSKMKLPYLYLTYPNENRVPWVPTQTDLLAEDWFKL